MTPHVAIVSTAIALIVLDAWLVYRYLAACQCAACPRGFAVYKRGELRVCSICARMHDYLTDYIETGPRSRGVSLRHNNPYVSPAQTAVNGAKPPESKPSLPRGGSIVGKILGPRHVAPEIPGLRAALSRVNDAP